MTRPVNIYALSRIHPEKPFNIIKNHHIGDKETPRIKNHEIESLRLFVDALVEKGFSISAFDGFFYSFRIPQIGKEFDLLKLSNRACLNIELKSTEVSKEKILEQLRRNQYYLRHMGKRLQLYSVVTDSMSCYKLSLTDELDEVDFEEIVNAVSALEQHYLESIDNQFKVSDYLVSPINTPERFLQGEYFLTQEQEQIRRSILKRMGSNIWCQYLHLTGKPGTGKTLLLYDIAKTVSKNGTVLVIHCGKLSDGQKKISKEIDQMKIIPIQSLNGNYPLEEYDFIFVDEAQRIYPDQFDQICESGRKNGQICLFSSDPEQILSNSEKKNNIVSRINELPPEEEFKLSERIRTNKELSSFIMQMMDLNHKPKIHMDYSNVEINYANTKAEAQCLLECYREKDYTFINYSKSNFSWSPYSEYEEEEDFDTHHVIGQEFDKVVMLMDDSFFYDDTGVLRGSLHPTPNYLYDQLFYQGATRVRDKLALIVVNAPELFMSIALIVEE